MSAGTPLAANYIMIDGKPYFLEKDEQGLTPIWTMETVPTQTGDPTVPRWVRFNDWSRGMGDSRGLLKGAVEYAENAFLGNIGRILPGPAVAEINTAHSADIRSFVSVTAPANRVLAGGGTKISEINPSTFAVATTRTPSGGASVLSMALFGSIVAIALGDSVDFDYRNASGTYAQNSLSKKARAFGIDDGRLVRGRSFYWSSCEAANFYSVDNWSTEYDIGDPSGNINQVFGHNRWSYILKDEGLYTFDEAGNQEANVLTDLATFKSAENRSYAQWNDLVFIPSFAGLYRYLQQGAARTVGLEEVRLNEATELINSYPTAMAAFGKWAYVSYYDGTSSRLCLMRRAEEGDTGMGSPFTLVSVLDKFTGKCQAMHISSLPTAPTLFYGRSTGAVGYFTITRDGLPASYNTGTVTVRMPPTDLGSPMTVKFFRSIEVVTRNMGGSKSLQLKAAMDGGAANDVGATVTASGAAERFFTQGSNDSGRTIQLTAVLVNTGGGTTPAELRECILNFEERPLQVRAYATVVRVEDFASDGGVVDDRPANIVRDDIEALIDGGVVDVVDPWGDTWKARVSRIESDITEQRRDSLPSQRMPIQLRRLDYS